MKSNPLKVLASVAVAGLAIAAPLSHANLVSNGGFETGDFSGWTLTGDTTFTGIDSLSAHSGSFGAYFGADSPGNGLAQSIATVAGATYVVDFWLQLDDSAVPNAFSWSWNGVTQALNLVDSSAFGYTEFSAMVTAAGSTSTLDFELTNPNSFWLLDDVSINVPEPGSLSLAASALLLLKFGRLRRRKGG